MKKNLLCLMVFSIAFVLYGQEQQHVEIKGGHPFWYMFMDFSGSYYQIPEKIPIFFQEIRKQQLVNNISGNLFSIYFDFDAQVTCVDTVWGLGFEMVKDTMVHLPLKKAQYDYEKFARMIHVGPYDMVNLTYNIMIPYLEENNMEVVGPPMQTWLDEDPDQVKPEHRRTEVIIPARKKK